VRSKSDSENDQSGEGESAFTNANDAISDYEEEEYQQVTTFERA
jgi:hypothetical protein